MIYALVGSDATDDDRETIAKAIKARNVGVLTQYASQGVIRHIMNIAEDEEYYCIWCLDHVSPATHNQPRGYVAAEPWFFIHNNNNKCKGKRVQIGANYYANEAGQGCYVQLGCEQVPHRNRRECQCIFGRKTYCHHATNPGPGGPCMKGDAMPKPAKPIEPDPLT